MSSWSRLGSARGLRNLALTGLASAVSAGLGGVATTPESAWYQRLDKPRWQPPALAFPLVWTPLYADIAVTTAAALTVLEEEGRIDEADGLRRSLALNLALNTGWSVVFWRVRRPWVSTAWCGVLTWQSLFVARRLQHVDPALHNAWAPYPAWTLFATALNASIARRNS
ncbi:TspO/MBR family protein [Marmoricola sp. URHB0036]|uniref:TspO/MBR family protein n=1 Tax=Marmoricola sp. URHB0036 TaxID=1298863 RepID=UPI0004265752|nr:TspO/MBR family protein [Marmoricola sp. URHB0036]